MAKKQKPKRRRSPAKKRRKLSAPKRPSLAKLAIAGGIIAITTAIGATQADRLLAGIQSFSTEAGLGVVTGARVVFIIVGLSALASVWKGFGKRYVAFLGKFGLRP